MQRNQRRYQRYLTPAGLHCLPVINRESPCGSPRSHTSARRRRFARPPELARAFSVPPELGALVEPSML